MNVRDGDGSDEEAVPLTAFIGIAVGVIVVVAVVAVLSIIQASSLSAVCWMSWSCEGSIGSA